MASVCQSRHELFRSRQTHNHRRDCQSTMQRSGTSSGVRDRTSRFPQSDSCFVRRLTRDGEGPPRSQSTGASETEDERFSIEQTDIDMHIASLESDVRTATVDRCALESAAFDLRHPKRRHLRRRSCDSNRSSVRPRWTEKALRAQ